MDRRMVFVETRSQEMRRLLCRWVEFFYEKGLRVQVLTDSTMGAQHLDQMLWTFSQPSFVPHRIFGPGESLPAEEPVLITASPRFLEGFDVLACDATPDVSILSRYPHTIHFIVMDDEDRRRASRLLWQKARDAGLELRHFRLQANEPTG